MMGSLTCKVCAAAPEYPTGQVLSTGFVCLSCIRKDEAKNEKDLVFTIGAGVVLTIVAAVVANHFF